MAFADKKDASKYVYQYTKDNYDRLSVTVPKGGKATIQAAADRAGQSVNAWINDAINDKLKGD